MGNPLNFKINEIFESIQGEGAHTGVPSIFIRLQGCPVGCSWCDTKHTWNVDLGSQKSAESVMAEQHESDHWFTATLNELLAIYQKQGYNAKHIILTGGEPCMYDLRALSKGLINAGFSVQVETSGTFEILIDPEAWVTVSPKVDMKGGYKVLDSALFRANEIKHPVAMEKHIEELKQLLEVIKGKTQPVVFLQPISQQARATQLAVETCIANNWRLSLQTHKFIGIE